ncbi:MAG: hypothetical protein EA391_06525 [Balneolaceae bacterium]|nr:MAG: hypothetical protein EA391_06525 [Balneolaceae bacterium]
MTSVNRFFFSALGLFLLFTTEAKSNDDPKFILIHLDAVSSEYFLQELEIGNLPNMHSFFGDQGRIDYTITYFPSKTPTVISSIREGDNPMESTLPGWKWSNESRENVVGMVGSFLRMAFSKSRLSTSNLLYGLPVFSWMAGPALINTAYYLNDYNILQFYWYNVDTQGHFNGEEAYLEQLAIFDKQFGRLMRRLDDDVNVIIYSDHGMTFGDGIEIDPVIEDLLGDDLMVFSYPTLYINTPGRKSEYAKKLVEETEIDYTFFELQENIVQGFHANGSVQFIKNYELGKIQYTYDGTDIFGYSDLGYNGEFLSRNEWLSLTYTSKYPMAPVNIYYHLNNEIAGDIVTLFNDQKYHQTGYSSAGNHGGFTDRDMTVPLLMKGPDVEQLYNKTYYWLPDLFVDIEGVDFDRRPPRDRHQFSSRYDFRNNRTVTQFSMSPKYRIQYGATAYSSDLSNFTDFDRVDVWGKADLFRSYLTRLWIGTGIEITDESVDPLLILQHDIHIRKFVLQNSFATNRSFYFRLSYEATPWLAIESVNFTSLGFRFDF